MPSFGTGACQRNGRAGRGRPGILGPAWGRETPRQHDTHKQTGAAGPPARPASMRTGGCLPPQLRGSPSGPHHRNSTLTMRPGLAAAHTSRPGATNPLLLLHLSTSPLCRNRNRTHRRGLPTAVPHLRLAHVRAAAPKDDAMADQVDLQACLAAAVDAAKAAGGWVGRAPGRRDNNMPCVHPVDGPPSNRGGATWNTTPGFGWDQYCVDMPLAHPRVHPRQL